MARQRRTRDAFVVVGAAALLAASIVLFVVASCSSFRGAPTNDDAASDGGIDSGNDASVQSGDSQADSATSNFCTSRAATPGGFKIVYCDDFDDAGGVADAHVTNGTPDTNGGSIRLDLTRFKTPPGAAHAALAPNADVGGVAVDVALPTSITRILIAYDVWLAPTADPDPVIGYLNSGNPCEYYVYVGSTTGGTKMRVQEYRDGNLENDLARLQTVMPRDEWHHILWDVAVATGEVVLSLDNTGTGQGLMIMQCRGKVPSDVRVGLPVTSTSSQDVWIDNIVVETK